MRSELEGDAAIAGSVRVTATEWRTRIPQEHRPVLQMSTAVERARAHQRDQREFVLLFGGRVGRVGQTSAVDDPPALARDQNVSANAARFAAAATFGDGIFDPFAREHDWQSVPRQQPGTAL